MAYYVHILFNEIKHLLFSLYFCNFIRILTVFFFYYFGILQHETRPRVIDIILLFVSRIASLNVSANILNTSWIYYNNIQVYIL